MPFAGNKFASCLKISRFPAALGDGAETAIAMICVMSKCLSQYEPGIAYQELPDDASRGIESSRKRAADYHLPMTGRCEPSEDATAVRSGLLPWIKAPERMNRKKRKRVSILKDALDRR